MRGYSHPGSKTAPNKLQEAVSFLPTRISASFACAAPYVQSRAPEITLWRLLQEPLCRSGSLHLFAVLASTTMR